jgi:nucleotide-binding universal stress UspA family protein
MFKQILVTTDGSPLGNLALPLAADLARKYDSDLTLLYVVPDQFPPVALSEGAAYAYDYQTETERLEQEGERFLETGLKLLEYPKAHTVLAQQRGHTFAEAITEQVQLSAADLIVMSTHGRRGLSHLFLGSVAEEVLHKLKIPVFLVHAPADPPKGKAAVQQSTTA